MKEVDLELYNVAKRLVQSQHKTVLLTGFRDSGKATALEALAKSPAVQKLLCVRENLQSGENITLATDCKEIQEDELLVALGIYYPDMKSLERSYTFTSVLSKAMRAYVCPTDESTAMYILNALSEVGVEPLMLKPPKKLEEYKIAYDVDSYTKTVKESLTKMLKEDGNVSRILGEINEKELDKLASIILKLSPKDLFDWAKDEHVNLDILSNFSIVKDSAQFIRVVKDEFYKTILELSKQQVSDVAKRFSQEGACVQKLTNPDRFNIVISLSDDTDSELIDNLLNSYFASRNDLYMDPVLIFRGNDLLFTDVEADGESFHTVTIKNTEDFPEYSDYEVEEYMGMVDYEDVVYSFLDSGGITTSVVFLVDASTNATLEQTIGITECIRSRIPVFVVFTHFDQLMFSFAALNTNNSKFGNNVNIDWEDCYEKATCFLDNKINKMKQSLVESKYFHFCDEDFPPKKDNSRQVIIEDLFLGYSATALNLTGNPQLQEIIKNNRLAYPMVLCKALAQYVTLAQ